jgi:hypothetical protein
MLVRPLPFAFVVAAPGLALVRFVGTGGRGGDKPKPGASTSVIEV